MRVSVIIPCYNYGRFVAEAVGSVQRQTVEDLEIIVVDDGSTDDTPDVLASIFDPRLRAVRIPNSGISGARNAGLELARGEFVALLDADDRWLPTKLERQLQLFDEAPELGMVFTNFSRFGPEGTFPKTQFDFVPELAALPQRRTAGGGWVLTGDAFIDLITPGQFATWVQTVLIRRSLITDLRFPPRHIFNEDRHFMSRVCLRVTAGYLGEPLVEVRRHGNNSYNTAAPRIVAEPLAFEDLLGESLTAPQRRALEHRIGRAWIAVAHYNFWSGGGARDVVQASLRSLKYPGTGVAAVKHLAALPLRPILSKRQPPA